MNEEEKILTIRVRNVCKDLDVENLSIFVSGLIEYAMEHDDTDTILGIPRICSGSNCIPNKTCKSCWDKEFNRLQEGGEPSL